MTRRAPALVLSVVLLIALTGATGRTAQKRPPNILFIVMDDVGIDQMTLFGYGGVLPPRTPTIDRVAGAGVRFGNTWSMPACTTSRAVFFSGRYPLRTNVLGALGPNDLANSHVSPFEVTTPVLLRPQGYKSALFGKFHLALQGNSPYGLSMVRSLGWDYFYGWLDKTGDPSSIDTTAGGVAKAGTWSCGFVPGKIDGGADWGACHDADGSCRDLSAAGPSPPGRTCRDSGGIFVPESTCRSQPPPLDFAALSGHYVSPLVIDHEDGTVEDVPSTDRRARTFRGTSVVDAAIAWIGKQPAGTPWMASVSFASAHTPVMQPPAHLISGPSASDVDCTRNFAERVMTNEMIEAMDAEIGRLLIATGLARRDPGGILVYEPAATDTMVVIVGDNGSFGGTVKPPFDYTRAKGTAYQTGVWVPLIVAGPLVRQPDRDVRAMVNVADLFQLFGEMAGIDVARAVPRPIDAVSMLPYLEQPQRQAIRRTNFTQVGPNIQANDALNGPCTIRDTCTQIPVTKEVCEDNGGTWWGVGADAQETQGIPAAGLTRCCEVDAFVGYKKFSIQPLTSVAVRNERYKVVRNTFDDYDPAAGCVATETNEFYQIDEAAPIPRLDEADLEITGTLTAEQRVSRDALFRQLDATLASQPACEGDGNIDGVVDSRDVDEWRYFALLSAGGSSWYDLNRDGLTDSQDLAIIRKNLGTRCARK